MSDSEHSVQEIRALLSALAEPFPPNAIETRPGSSGKPLSYVSHDTVTRRLNACIPGWSSQILETMWSTVDIKNNKTQQMETYPLLIQIVRVSHPVAGSHDGLGVQVIRPNGGEDQFKGAESDAIKRAAMRFGVALELYGPDLEAGEMHMNAPVSGGSQPYQPGGNAARNVGQNEPPTGPQSNEFARLITNLDIDPAFVAKTVARMDVNRLDKLGMSRCIGWLKKVEAGEITGDFPKHPRRDQPQHAAPASPALAVAPQPQTNAQAAHAGWVRSIKSAPNTARLDAIYKGMEEAGLGEDDELVALLSQRADELEAQADAAYRGQ